MGKRRVTELDKRRGNYVEPEGDKVPTKYAVYVKGRRVKGGLSYRRAVLRLRAELEASAA